MPEFPIDSGKNIKRNNYLLKTQSVVNKQENEAEKNLFATNNNKKLNNLVIDSLRPQITYRNSLQGKDTSEVIINDELYSKISNNTTRNFSHSKQMKKTPNQIQSTTTSAAAFEDEKLLVFKNTRFQINANFKNNYRTNIAAANCRKCGCYNNENNNNNEINFLNNDNNNDYENITSCGYSDDSKNENRESNLKTLYSYLNKNLGEEILSKEKTGNK